MERFPPFTESLSVSEVERFPKRISAPNAATLRGGGERLHFLQGGVRHARCRLRGRLRTNEELKREIEDLKAKVAFLSIWSPTGRHRPRLSGFGFTDVVLVAAEDGPNGGPSMPVPAHRAIMASQSQVFKAMLENEMDESRSGTIKISDMSYDALRAFVGYLYVEACLDEEMACDLLVLAEKYRLEHLKAYCEKFLVSKLNWDNSIKNYAFAHQQKAKVLLEAALSLILDSMYKLEEHQEYWEFVNKDPCLVMKIYQAFVAKLFNRKRQISWDAI